MSFTRPPRLPGTPLEVDPGVTRLEYCSKLLANTSGRFARPVALGVFAAVLTVSAASQQPAGTAGKTVNPRAATIKGFLDRVDAYIELREKAADGIPKLSGNDDPSRIEAHQAALAARIRLARPHAKAGDIFGDAAPVFHNVIREDTSLRTRRDTKASLEEVPKHDPPKVNTSYPEKTPVATVPPLILDALPRLPDGLEYRFMGKDLILRDEQANLIIDILNSAAPAPKGG